MMQLNIYHKFKQAVARETEEAKIPKTPDTFEQRLSVLIQKKPEKESIFGWKRDKKQAQKYKEDVTDSESESSPIKNSGGNSIDYEEVEIT